MSSGKTHGLVSVLSGMTVCAVSANEGYLVSGVMMLAGSCLGILLSPDLDQQGFSWIENKLRKSRVLPVSLFGYAHIIYWYPYALIIPHRHWSSHLPGVGTILRLAYLSPLFYFINGLTLNFPSSMINWDSLGWIITGLVLSDSLHWLFDNFT